MVEVLGFIRLFGDIGVRTVNSRRLSWFFRLNIYEVKGWIFLRKYVSEVYVFVYLE